MEVEVQVLGNERKCSDVHCMAKCPLHCALAMFVGVATTCAPRSVPTPVKDLQVVNKVAAAVLLFVRSLHSDGVRKRHRSVFVAMEFNDRGRRCAVARTVGGVRGLHQFCNVPSTPVGHDALHRTACVEVRRVQRGVCSKQLILVVTLINNTRTDRVDRARRTSAERNAAWVNAEAFRVGTYKSDGL